LSSSLSSSSAAAFMSVSDFKREREGVATGGVLGRSALRRLFSSSLPGPGAFWDETLLLGFPETTTGGCLSVSLNRPRQLNALNVDMVTALHALLPRVEEDPRVSLLLLSGQGGRAFCAGGDIRQVAGAPRADVARLFGHEYALVFKTSKFKKPHVALWDGIVMGNAHAIKKPPHITSSLR
ncbi:enoyl-CoA hydratase/isomerase, partial [Toxoplasma gondii FOU]